MLADLPLEERIEQDGRDGLTVRTFLQRLQDVPQRDPLLREEAAAGVAVHAQVDLAVRQGADVVGQPGTRSACRRCRWPGRASSRPVRLISSSCVSFVDGDV